MAEEENPSQTRVARIGAALAARPPRNIRIGATALDGISRGDAEATDKLARVAVEIFLRRNACFPRTEAVDGRLSAAEERAIRNCAVLQEERLVRNGQPDAARAIDWLERIIGG